MDISTTSWRLIGRSLQPVLKAGSLVMTPMKRKRESIQLPIMPSEVQETELAEVERSIESLTRMKTEWRKVSCAERSCLLHECLQGISEVALGASEAATTAHGSFGTGIGEELAFWVPVALALMEYKQAMDHEGSPPVFKLTKRDNQYIADVFPKGILGTLFGNIKVEVWIPPGKEPTQGRVYREKSSGVTDSHGAVSLVLGAGNHINVVILDVLHKLICDDEVVLVKMNPQNAFLGIYVEKALLPFFRKNFVKLVFGGAELGQHITQHSSIDNIHLTGSVQTFNKIVYGLGKSPTKESVPLLKKSVTAELGCVTPAIVVPGDWSEKEMQYVATTIVSGLINNSSHNCCALEVPSSFQDFQMPDKMCI